jgi:hypothetical protein
MGDSSSGSRYSSMSMLNEGLRVMWGTNSMASSSSVVYSGFVALDSVVNYEHNLIRGPILWF